MTAPVPPPEQAPGDGLREALDYLRMPEVTKGKYAVVPIKGDRAAVAVIEAAIVKLTAERDEAQTRAADLAAENVRLREALEAIWFAIPGFNESDHLGLMTTHVDGQNWWETVVPLVCAALAEPRHDR